MLFLKNLLKSIINLLKTKNLLISHNKYVFKLIILLLQKTMK